MFFILEKGANGFFVATVSSLLGCISPGKTEKEVLKNIREAIQLHVDCLVEDGLPLVRKSNAKELL